MPDGSELLDELKYKEHIKKLSLDEKVDYLIDKVYDLSQDHSGRVSRKQISGISTAVSAIVAGAISAIMTHFRGG